MVSISRGNTNYLLSNKEEISKNNMLFTLPISRDLSPNDFPELKNSNMDLIGVL